MPQETNLNVAPYFDDYDPTSNYYKVLFKPAYPVQARELNNLQSIVQDQIEKFGDHIFKEGAKVIPGQLTYLRDYDCIQIEDTFLGIPVSLYLDKVVGQTITGAVSGVTAQVVNYISNQESEKGNYTLYINYFESSTTDAETPKFLDDEGLILSDAITYATTFIAAGESFAKTITEDANATGSAYSISEGVYYLRGHFVSVYDDTLILDQYSNTPSYRIGFNVREEIISADVDPTLNDNAQGFTNYTAPGADRVKITATLAKKDPNDFEDSNFVQLAVVTGGVLRENKTQGSQYEVLANEFARRTFDESGHYYVKNFQTSLRESLNNNLGNRGIYQDNQITEQGNTPSDGLAVLKILPGKAYVKGYEVNTVGPIYLDVSKPRTTKSLLSQGVNFGFGPSFTANRIYGAPTIAINSDDHISMRDTRIGAGVSAGAGKEIGVCRVYDFALESGSYDSSSPQLNQWDISLFDIQTYSDLDLNRTIDLAIPTRIEGKNSGATAYLRYTSSGVGLTAYDVKGEFFVGEKITFNGNESSSRTITGITNHEISDVKSLHQNISGRVFNADLLQSTKETVGIASIAAASGSRSIITSPGIQWVGIASVGNLVQYSDPTNNVPSFGEVTDVSPSNLTIKAVTDVAGYRLGALPTSDLNVTDFKVVETKKQKSSSGGNSSDGESIYTVLPKINVSSVSTDNAEIIVRKEFTVNISNNSSDSVSTGSNETFMAFDEERYTLVRSDGTFEILTQDKFAFSGGSKTLIINGLGSNDNGAKLMTTVKKSKVTSKIKRKNIGASVVVDKSSNPSSGTGSTTLNDGLTYGSYPFGTRVQDEEISFNYPDVNVLYGVYESDGIADPVVPNMVTSLLSGPTSTTDDLIVGELVIGTESGAIALYFGKKSDVSIEFILQTDTLFLENEQVTFKDSGVTAVASNIVFGSKNIVQNFNVTNSQEKTYYNISRLIRREGAPTPSNKIKICFCYSDYDSSDDGDITTINSYVNFNYGKQLPFINGVKVSDIIDGRPRVSPYTVSENSRSPFEFFGRSFTGGQHSSKDIIASDETLTIDYSYYLPRADSLFLNTKGEFTLKQGTPSDDPQFPDPIPNQMAIANISLPSYLYDTRSAQIDFVEHKRYQMKDIAKLEKRISNLEYYSALSQLESDTVNQFTPDANGLNRFKSGIFVDNFTSLLTQDPGIGVKNAIDKKSKSLRPSHYCNALNLQLGSTGVASNDERFNSVDGNNVRREGNTLMLDYEEVEWLKNPFATRVVNVTPFMVTFWAGSITLVPDTDVWIDVNIMEPNNVEFDNSGFEGISEILGFEVETDEDGNRMGVGPVVWESWETTGVISESSSTRNSTSRRSTGGSVTRRGANAEQEAAFREQRGIRFREGRGEIVVTTRSGGTNTTTTTSTTTTTTVSEQERTGQSQTLSESVQTESLGSAVVSREVIHYMRSRNIECTSTSMKPYTRFYPFFDDIDVNKFCTPKLIEIEMSSGTFQVGETVSGVMRSSEDNENVNQSTVANIIFRVASSNHKYGAYNDPSDIYESSPYDKDLVVPVSYSETSVLLNVDTFSLQDENQTDFSGYISNGMIIRGSTSGAEATVRNVRLISDKVGTMIYNFLVPPSNNNSNQVFETGQSRMRLTTSSVNSRIDGIVTSSAEATFYSQGTLDQKQESTLSIKNLEFGFSEPVTETQEVTSTSSSRSTRSRRTTTEPRTTVGQTDPLAQSFYVDDESGIFVSSIDVFFQAKPEVSRVPVTCQLREMELGTPTTRILPFSEIHIDPRDITTSQDASVATNIKFKSPVYLQGETEYCVVFLSHNTEYVVWVSRLGEPDVSTLGQEEGQILVSTQPLLGSLFKSQNASTWTPSQYEDLTFTLYRSEFVEEGNAQFYNPDLPKNIELISKDNVKMKSKELKIQTSIGVTATIDPGNTIVQANTNASGSFLNFGGSASGTLTITNVGVGYTPSAAGHFTFTGVALTSLTGSGIDATANITVENGIAIGATIASGGTGHQVGDLLSPISIGDGLGISMSLTVDSLSSTNQVVLTGVQGNFSTNSSDTLSYTTSVGVSSALSVYPVSPILEINDGLEFEVRFKNHGMHAPGNIVTLSGLEGSSQNTKLSVEYGKTDTGAITIASTTGFTQFEGVGVGATNPGYIIIGNEIISYTGFTGNTLTGITRGIDNTDTHTCSQNNLVRKYEMNGVSLRRINTNHLLGSSDADDAITLDSYKISLDMGDTNRGTDRSNSGPFTPLHFTSNKSGGGRNGRSTYNQQFELMIPNFSYITPEGTSVDGTIRTISATSVSGSELSFTDQGSVDITFQTKNYFETPRMIASKVNELQYLNDLTKNKSLTLNMNIQTDDSRLSPMVDLDKTTCQFITNRVNKVITNYSDDFRANTVLNDPSKFIYASNITTLENPATSIEVRLDAYIQEAHDIRLFYAIDQDGPLSDIVFIPFPGYKNQDTSRPGGILDPSKSDGTPDTNVPKTDVVIQSSVVSSTTEYKFTADLLPQFTSYRIKVVATSTNQAVVPQIRNIRVVALA